MLYRVEWTGRIRGRTKTLTHTTRDRLAAFNLADEKRNKGFTVELYECASEYETGKQILVKSENLTLGARAILAQVREG